MGWGVRMVREPSLGRESEAGYASELLCYGRRPSHILSMKYFTCIYQVRVSTCEILHRYSVDEGLGDGLDGERREGQVH